MSYVSSFYHCVFSTQERRKLITPDLQARLWPFLGGIARQNDMKALNIGGVEDHVHMLLSLPATIPISKAMQLIKGGSSKWIHETFPQQRLFAWQKKYGAFSVVFLNWTWSQITLPINESIIAFKSFQEEFLELLKKHQIEYDERYLWD